VNLSIVLEQPDKKLALFGSADRHLRMIRDTFGVQIVGRDDELKLAGEGPQVAKAAAVLEQLQKKLRRQDWLSVEDVGQAIGRAAEQDRQHHEGEIDVYAKGHQIKPKTEGQKAYAEAIFNNDLTFCIGPAGTGKTYLAVAAAASLLKHGQARRIVLARPAVEAGERLGFLPGDLQAKVNPYLRPLFDALHDMIDFEQVKRFMVNDVIEVIPLAFMRGRTLNDSVIILDEAQNTTPSQMLMFLTRLGHDSKMIITGDTSQVDLPGGTRSGLVDAVEKLRGIKGIGLVELDRADIVRHRLVQNIVNAYERAGGVSDSRPARGERAGNRENRPGKDERSARAEVERPDRAAPEREPAAAERGGEPGAE
jgi:phosphate starvation-inducible protein PhoH and related proteins